MAQVAVLVLGVLFAVVGTGVCAWIARRQWALRRELARADRVDAGTLKRGAVELAGRAVPAGETITSPLTGQECLAYTFTVERRQRTRSSGSEAGGLNHQWSTITDEEGAVPFYVEDETGRALVDAPVADFELERDTKIDTRDVERGLLGKLKAMLLGGDTTSDLPVTDERREEMESAHRRRRYHERLLLPDVSVYVYGEAMPPESVPTPADQLRNLGGRVVDAGLALLPGGEAISAVRGGAKGSRRTKRRELGSDDFEDIEAPEPNPAAVQETVEELDVDPAEMREKDPDELSEAERQRLEAASEEVLDHAESQMETVDSALEEVAETLEPGGDGDPFAGEDLVVSRGEAVGEFVVSDREKGQLLGSYTKSTLKWIALAVIFLAVGVATIANELGLVS